VTNLSGSGRRNGMYQQAAKMARKWHQTTTNVIRRSERNGNGIGGVIEMTSAASGRMAKCLKS